MPDKLAVSLLIGGGVSASLIQSTDKTKKALAGLNSSLQKLKQAEQSASSLGSLKTSLEETKEKLKNSSAETARLAKAFRYVKDPSDKLIRSFQKSKRETEALNKEFRGQVSAISALRLKLKEAGVDTTKLTAEQQRLATSMKAVSAAEKRLASARAARLANRQQINAVYGQAAEAAAMGYSLKKTLSVFPTHASWPLRNGRRFGHCYRCGSGISFSSCNFGLGHLLTDQRYVRMVHEGCHQIVRIPHGFELPGDKALLQKEGSRLTLKPVMQCSLLQVLETLDPIEDTFCETVDAPPDEVFPEDSEETPIA